MELDPSKNFMFMEDNEDGTVTTHLNFPKAGIKETTIVEMNFEEIFGLMIQMALAVPEEISNPIFDRATVVPNSLEG